MVYGLSIINRGEGYNDYTKTTLNSVDGDIDLSTKVTLNFEKVDNVINPQEMLNAHCVMFNISMTTDEIKDLTYQKRFEFFGFSKNAKQIDSSGNTTPIGSTTPTGIASFQRATHRITVAKLLAEGAAEFSGSWGATEPTAKAGSSDDKSRVQTTNKIGINKGEMKVSSVAPQTYATRLDLELYPNSRRADSDSRTEIDSITNIVNQADTSTINLVTSTELSSVVDTGKIIHTGTNLNFELPPNGQKSVVRMRVTKCF